MRARESSIHITTIEKYKIVHDNKLPKSNEKVKENYKILKDYIAANKVKKEMITNAPTHNITIKVPKYEGFKKSYNTKDKPIKFHERATVLNLGAGEINESQKPVNFKILMAMFDSKEEIGTVDIEKLLCLDLEKLGSLKDKIGRIIEYVNSNDCDCNKKEEVIKSLNDKVELLKNNEEDIENVLVNVSSIEKIIYGKEETKVIFK